MTGVKLGDRLLHVGCTDASLLGAIGSKVGLSGRVCAVVPDEAQARPRARAAERSGFLLEIETGDLETFPVRRRRVQSDRRRQSGRAAVEHAARAARGHAAAGVSHARAARPDRRHRARARAAASARCSGSSASAPVDPHYKSSGGAIVALEAEGFRAARLLAERDGLSFFEGVR